MGGVGQGACPRVQVPEGTFGDALKHGDGSSCAATFGSHMHGGCPQHCCLAVVAVAAAVTAGAAAAAAVIAGAGAAAVIAAGAGAGAVIAGAAAAAVIAAAGFAAVIAALCLLLPPHLEIPWLLLQL